ncbi:protocatechuate 3,4-dioxygenase beta chain-like [Pecten maximus]|uniref:protocatechuate 3,4-dioxygenase beta chain-like n=1 Tax=Pecten maximus TaxID=6579 RepID=UPI001458BADF|nr:protocatechuate 3,4-dioxygenase beta chain-like [Pecten maximus]
MGKGTYVTGITGFINGKDKMAAYYISLLILLCRISSVNGNGGNSNNCRPTSHDIIGPYYVPNPPRLLQYCTGDPERHQHERLFVHGYVYKSDCSTPMTHTRIDVWQADLSGNYTLEARCRGYLRTDSRGYYEFSTLYPGKYHLFSDANRPAHIHFKVYGKRRHKTLITQLYFAGDSSLGTNDPCTVCSSDREDLIANVEYYCEPNDHSDCIQVVRFDITLERGRGVSQT